MKRLTFLAPDLERAQAVVEELRKMDVPEDMMHVVAADHEMLVKAHIHEATDMETSELETDFDWGIVAGGVLGLIIGFISYQSIVFGFEFGALSILAFTIIGAFLGGWVGKAIGESTPSGELEKYQHAIEAGQILMMIDVAVEQVPAIYKMVRKHCPKALVESTHLFHDHPLAA